MAYFGKTFKQVKEENFDAFIDALKAPDNIKALFKAGKPEVKVTKNGDGTFTINTSGTGYSSDLTFTPGVEFDETMVDGTTKAKTTVNVDGDTYNQVQKFPDDGAITIKREFSENELKTTYTASFWNDSAQKFYKS